MELLAFYFPAAAAAATAAPPRLFCSVYETSLRCSALIWTDANFIRQLRLRDAGMDFCLS